MIEKDEIDNYVLLKKWKNDMTVLIKSQYPKLSDDKINTFLDKKIKKKLDNNDCQLYNNYVEKVVNTNLLDITQFYYEKKPIPTPHGVFFKQHSEAFSPSNKMVSGFLANRKAIKKEMSKHLKQAQEFEKLHGIDDARFKDEFYKFKKCDRGQLREKVMANSFYGGSGLKSCVFYNLHAALSVTGAGQCLISTAAMTFEAFLANNVKFQSMNECLVFIKNVLNEKKDRRYKDKNILDNDVLLTDVLNKLKSTFINNKIYNEELLLSILSNLDQENLNRLYYKNNLYKFTNNTEISSRLLEIMNSVESFKNPNDIPSKISGDLGKLYSIFKEYVLYNHETYDRINRLKYQPRATVIVIDTDSNFINLNPWYEYCLNEIADDKFLDRDNEENKFIIINIMCVLLSKAIEDALKRYCENANIIDEDKIKLLNMKNEYLLQRILLTTSKKNYAAIQLLKEGNLVPKYSQINITGLDIKKSTVSDITSSKLTKILEDYILRADNINIPDILRAIEKYESEIRDNILSGSKDYLKPMSVSSIERYKEPYSEQGVRAILNWNIIYPDRAISLPDKIDVIKMKTGKLEKILPLYQKDPELFSTIKEGIFNSDIKNIREKGLDVIAIPRSVEKVPSWMLEYVNIDKTINDNVDKFIKILYSTGLKKINIRATDNFYSNILSF